MKINFTELKTLLQSAVDSMAVLMVQEDKEITTIEQIESTITFYKSVRTEFTSIEDLQQYINEGNLSVIGYASIEEILEDLED